MTTPIEYISLEEQALLPLIDKFIRTKVVKMRPNISTPNTPALRLSTPTKTPLPDSDVN